MSADPLKLRLHVETEFVRQISRALDRRFGGSFAVAHSAADSAALSARSAADSADVGGGVSLSRGGADSSAERATASELMNDGLPKGLKWHQVVEKLIKALRQSKFPSVRKYAASALGKCVSLRPNATEVCFALSEQIACEENDQARQYEIKALARYGKDAARFLDVLKDAARDDSIAAYVRSAAADAVAGIQQANHADYARAYHWCARCRRRIPVQQFTVTRQRYGRGYCRHCADEIGLENQNFESTVEGAKRLRSSGGTAVQSRGEQRIAEFLERERIAYEYDERYRVAADLMIRPDFYLPEFDLYIEYWGMDTQEYRERKLRKRILYQRERKKLIEIVSGDLDRLDEVLREKLGRYIRI